jgi:hypothetical protein
MKELKSKSFTQRVENYNCIGMCAEQTCNKKYKRFVKIQINSLIVVIPFCNEHAETWEKWAE